MQKNLRKRANDARLEKKVFFNKNVRNSFVYRLFIMSFIFLVFLIMIWIGLFFLKIMVIEKPLEKPEGLGTMGIFSAEGGEMPEITGFGYEEITGVNFPDNCTNESLKASWDSIFNENSNNISIVKNSNCSLYFLSKVDSGNVIRVIFGVNLEDKASKTQAIYSFYGNYSEIVVNFTRNFNESYVEGSVGNVLFGLYLIYIDDSNWRGDRIISNLENANNEFATVFKVKNGTWQYDPGSGDYSAYYFQNKGTGGVFINYTIDVFFHEIEILKPINLTQIKEIEKIEFYDETCRIVKLDDYFANLGLKGNSNLTINYSISFPGSLKVFENDFYWHELHIHVNSTTPKEQKMNLTISYKDVGVVNSDNFNISIYECGDYDGFNPNNSGETHNSSVWKFDYCIDNSNVMEYYCNKDSVENKSIACLSDQYCNYNACRKKINLTQIRNISDAYVYNVGWWEYFDLDYYFDNLGYRDSNLSFNYSCLDCPFNVSYSNWYNELMIRTDSILVGNYSMNIIFSYPGLEKATSNNFRVFLKTCNDSDGWDKYIKGNVRNSSETKEDYCINDKNLTEFYCSFGNVHSYNTTCYDEYYCSDGKCVENMSYYCWDSDGGKNENVKGTVTNRSYDYGTSNYVDSCLNSSAVLEYYCDNSSGFWITPSNSTVIQCAFGKNCSDGACAIPVTSPTDPSNPSGPSNPSSPSSPINQTNNTIIISNMSEFRIKNAIPRENNFIISEGENKTFSIDGGDYQIRWYIDGKNLGNGSTSIQVSNLSIGNHSVKVEILKGTRIETKTWLFSVIGKEKLKPGLDLQKIIFYVILVVVVVTTILFLILMFVQKRETSDSLENSPKISVKNVADLSPARKISNFF